jgi:hypothetical protein
MRLAFPVGIALMLALDRPGADLPPIGIAVADSGRAWCAEFRVDSAIPAPEPGRVATIVLDGPGDVLSLGARIGEAHSGQCPAAFPQPRWNDYAAYDLELTDALPALADGVPTVALVIASEVHWTRGPDGAVRADLDGDGAPEEVRRCTADEGEHLTVWSRRPGGGHVRRWHEYYDWGGLTDPTCRPGEDGR